MHMRMALLLLLLLPVHKLAAQTCTTLGQTPSTAFPVCGTSKFSQADVPPCGGRNLPIPSCNGDNAYQDLNPFWYRFTCYTAGTLGFTISPKVHNDDYDWMLYDITGHNPNDVFTDQSLIVTGNWSGEPGNTGAATGGATNLVCGSTNNGPYRPLFTAMPTLTQGHEYLLLISHFDGNSQSGYELDFSGGSAVITDPTLPALDKAIAGCGGVTVTLTLNKKMKCNSLAANGSDFTISPANASIVSATGIGCSNSFDLTQVVLTLNGALTPGNYTLTAKNGNDGNTLLDNCNNAIAGGNNVSFVVDPIQPTPLDSITPVACEPKTLELVFDKPMLCNSIAANGSDFRVTGGTSPVTVTGAAGVNCVNGKSDKILVTLAAPIQTGGTYQINLVNGSDGNTIIDECGQVTPPTSLPFLAADTVNANFSYQLLYGCTADTVDFTHPGNNGVNDWKWNFNNEGTSSLQNPRYIFRKFGYKNIELIVSNGVCKDTASNTIHLDNELDAAFSYPEVVCPRDKATFKDESTGKIISWNWTFGDGGGSTLQQPFPYQYPKVSTGTSKTYIVQLVVENDLHCKDTAKRSLKVVASCYIAVPNAFTPNHDAKNDFLYPLNAWKAKNLVFTVYNRYGQRIYETKDWTKPWDGTLNGMQQSTGVYVWTLRYIDTDTGKEIFQKGTTVLLR